MAQLFHRVEEVLSDHLEVAERNGVWTVDMVESGIKTTYDFPSQRTADQFAATERLRLGRK
ncbi:hypothetical protein J5285_14820 [Agrobacterium larrymoorei]|uniref:Uncharacterized protein n=1 Tax=Agrobacterium larrymoorei TaxID=160699 RepID=A0ABX8T5X5_9HYPH|nr:hypothetical protein J5285_14820 [Agrobacterium larrymoorei]